MSSATELPVTPEIDTLLLIDRTADFVTPLCTQLTYEGLIDEIFGINNATVDLPQEKFFDSKTVNKENIKPGSKKKFALNSNDKIYRDIRDLNLRAVTPFLNKKAKDIDQYYKERHKAQTVSQLKDYIEKLRTFQQKHQYLQVRIQERAQPQLQHNHKSQITNHIYPIIHHSLPLIDRSQYTTHPQIP